MSIKNENLTKELQNLDQSLAAKNNQLIEIQSKLGLSEKNYIKKCQEIEMLETKISNLVNKDSDISEKNKSNEAIISDLQSQITTLTNQNTILQDSQLPFEGKISNLESKLTTLEKENESLRTQLVTTINKVEHVPTSTDAAQNAEIQIKTMNIELQTLQKEQDDLLELLADQQLKIKSYGARLRDHGEEVTDDSEEEDDDDLDYNNLSEE